MHLTGGYPGNQTPGSGILVQRPTAAATKCADNSICNIQGVNTHIHLVGRAAGAATTQPPTPTATPVPAGDLVVG